MRSDRAKSELSKSNFSFWQTGCYHKKTRNTCDNLFILESLRKDSVTELIKSKEIIKPICYVRYIHIYGAPAVPCGK